MSLFRSDKWRHTILIASAVLIVLFIGWRALLNNYVAGIIYALVHLYEIIGIYICYLIIEYDDYFSAEKVR